MIDGSVSLALRSKLPKIVIGATILSLGTTMPEAFVSVMAAVMGNPGLALGNGVGSIITDTGLIFGITVLITSTQMNKWILSRTGWWQIGSAGLLVVFALISSAVHPGTPVISRWMGAVFVLLLIVYLWKNYNWARNKESHGKDEVSEVSTEKVVSPFQIFILLLGGLFFVIIASRLLIPAAGEIALRLNVPDDVIAATMVAFGTSLPELVTAIAAIKKGHPEITIGNIIGADVLNVLFVIGLASFATPLAIPGTFFRIHFPTMILILLSFRLFIGMNRGGHFRRWQGFCLLLIYAAYIAVQYFVVI